MNDRQARVAAESGLMPYIRQAARVAFFDSVFAQMQKVGTNWSSYAQHGDLLRGFQEYGGLDACPPEQLTKVLSWMVLTYIGTPGGRTSFGNVRNVFYSNSAVPIITSLVQESKSNLKPLLSSLRTEKVFKGLLSDSHIARRFEAFVDMVN